MLYCENATTVVHSSVSGRWATRQIDPLLNEYSCFAVEQATLVEYSIAVGIGKQDRSAYCCNNAYASLLNKQQLYSTVLLKLDRDEVMLCCGLSLHLGIFTTPQSSVACHAVAV